MLRFYIFAAFLLSIAVLAPLPSAVGQSTRLSTAQTAPESSVGATLQGYVRDVRNLPIPRATVILISKDGHTLTTRTDSAGTYKFSSLSKSEYNLSAKMAGYEDAPPRSVILNEKNKALDITLVLNKTSEKSSGIQPDFFDEPHFTVAGVTDASNLGGHGSDTIVRNRELLVRETASLGKPSIKSSSLNAADAAQEKTLRKAVAERPADFKANSNLGKFLVEQSRPREALPYLETAFNHNPEDFDNASALSRVYADSGDYKQARSVASTLMAERAQSPQAAADLHHLLADIDEKLGDPLEAVREYEHAVELNATEANFFDWGAELLLHHASEPAKEVFTKGNILFPHSVPILAGLGAAFYSLGLNDEAARSLCEASDIDPNDADLYLLMGTMESAGSAATAGIDERLERFAKLQPQNPWANYYYAVSLQARRKSPNASENLDRVISLLQTAIRLDPHFGLAYLQLGNIYSERKEVPKAMAAYQLAITANPELEQAHYRLAGLYRDAGEADKAHSEFQIYEQISKDNANAVQQGRRDVQQFIYKMRDSRDASLPQ
jgi:tetratricopeptide (TPR) repeat protein